MITPIETHNDDEMHKLMFIGWLLIIVCCIKEKLKYA